MNEQKEKVVSIGCGNVVFYLMLQSDFEWNKFQYLADKIEKGFPLKIPDLFGWCNAQNISYISRYRYMKNYSVGINMINFFFYLRCRMQNRKELLAAKES